MNQVAPPPPAPAPRHPPSPREHSPGQATLSTLSITELQGPPTTTTTQTSTQPQVAQPGTSYPLQPFCHGAPGSSHHHPDIHPALGSAARGLQPGTSYPLHPLYHGVPESSSSNHHPHSHPAPGRTAWDKLPFPASLSRSTRVLPPPPPPPPPRHPPSPGECSPGQATLSTLSITEFQGPQLPWKYEKTRKLWPQIFVYCSHETRPSSNINMLYIQPRCITHWSK